MNIFTNWNYKPTKPSFVSLEIGTNIKATCATSFIFVFEQREQPIVTTKPVNPIRGGTCFKIIPLFVTTLTILVEVIIKHVVISSLVVSSKLETLKFLFTTIPLTPPQIGVGSDSTFQHTSCIRGIYNAYNNL